MEKSSFSSRFSYEKSSFSSGYYGFPLVFPWFPHGFAIGRTSFQESRIPGHPGHPGHRFNRATRWWPVGLLGHRGDGRCPQWPQCNEPIPAMVWRNLWMVIIQNGFSWKFVRMMISFRFSDVFFDFLGFLLGFRWDLIGYLMRMW